MTHTFSPIFEEFSLNAAAEGLFHPASTIEAFIEHDAKYNAKGSSKPSSGRSSLSSRSGSRSSTVGEYLPSLENQKLPVLLNEKGKRVKLDSTSSASSSSLLESPGRGGASRNSTMGSTRSDSDLHAPRRLGAVPSSADRNALDFYDHEDGTDDESGDGDHRLKAALRAKSSPPNLESFSLSSAKVGSTKSLGGSKSVSTLSEPQQPDDSLLTKKFEDLKLLMNAKKKTKPIVSTGQHNSGAPQDSQATAPGTKSHSKSRESSQSTNTATASSNSLGTKLTEKATSSSRGMKPTVTATPKAVPEDRRHASATISVPIVVKTPPIKSKKDMKIRNGVSLSDLKEEHRAALEMLKELGGPVDTDYESVVDAEEKSKAPAKVRIARAMKTKETGKVATATSSRSQKLLSSSGTGKSDKSACAAALSSTSPRDQISESEQSSSSMSHTGGSLVAKLRASIPSGRVKTPEPIEESGGVDRMVYLLATTELSEGVSTSHSVPATMAPATLDATKDSIISGAAMSAANFVLCRQERSLENVAEVDEEDDAEVANDLEAADQNDGEPDVEQVTFDDSWKKYEDEEDADEDNDDNDDDNEPLDGGDDQFASELNRSAPATARSVDLYGDEGFESEW